MLFFYVQNTKQPMQSFTVIPQSTTHVRIAFRNMYPSLSMLCTMSVCVFPEMYEQNQQIFLLIHFMFNSSISYNSHCDI